MGVRFACHACGRRLNVKSELAGRRGICPTCSVRFRVPAHDTQTSTPVDASEAPSPDDSSVPTRSSAQAPQNQRSDVAQAAIGSGASGRTTASQQSTQAQREDSGSRQPSLDEVLGGTSATWYVRPSSGGQFGPADGPTLSQWISEGRVADSAMLWRDGWPEWRIARSVLPSQKEADPPRVEQVAPPTRLVKLVPVVNVNDVPAAVPDSDPGTALRTGGKVLDTNKKRMSRKRVTISVVLALVFILLLSALIFVVLRS